MTTATRDDLHARLLDLIPDAACRVLCLGRHGRSLANRLQGRPSLDVTVREDLDDGEPDWPAGPFDCVVAGAALEQARSPEVILQRVRSLLTPEGQLLADFGNMRHHQVVTALLEGTWDYEPSEPFLADQLRFFTRREVEKLYYRAGFTVTELQALPGPGYGAWEQRGRPREVKVGPLHIGGLPPEEAEEFHVGRYLVRAAPKAVPDYGLTSIVIVTHNQLAYTRACLDSIRLCTAEPYELILVDNASTDGTPHYLRSVGATVITNATNRGFPAAANQGIRAATGRQVLLLNNDTVVTTGWLRRQLDALYCAPKIGLVGPCSNRVSGEQQIAVGYDDDLTGLDGFAWDWGKANDGRRIDTDRLVGFCLLCRKEVLDAVGLLDERFGVGCFEDDDLCLRALRADYRAVIAVDAFVHHFGGRTFVGSGVDFAGLMRHNQSLFREKWSKPDQPTVSPATPTPRKQKPAQKYTVRAVPGGGLFLERTPIVLSLCIIVRDNARTIEPCLRSIRAWVDEMVVVDTGSTDQTPKLVERLGGKLFHFPWCDSFSAARNESLRHAKGRWIFWMDSDDTIDKANGRKLRDLIKGEIDPAVLGFVCQVHCTGPGETGQLDVTVVDHVKLFRNLPQLKFEGRIHEQILPAIRRAGGQVARTDIFVTHSGYDHSPEGQAKKIKRDLHLLDLEHQEQPDHPFTLFNLGMTYADIGEYEKAAGFLTRSIQKAGEGESHLRKAYALLVHCYAQLGRLELAQETCGNGTRLFPEDLELRFRQGVIAHEAGRLDEAVRAYEGVLTADDTGYFSSMDRGIRGYKARQNLAVVYTDLGDLGRAEQEWRRVVEEVPQYRQGWRGLGEVLLSQRKYDALQEVIGRLDKEKGMEGEVLLLRGRLASAQGRQDEARELLGQAVREHPEDAEPLQALCRFLFEQGEPSDAEGPLLELIRRSPQDPAAHHNLGTTYLRLCRPWQAVDAFRQSLHFRPKSIDTLLQLGSALATVGRLAEAVSAWEQVLRLEPGNRAAQDALRQVEECGRGR